MKAKVKLTIDQTGQEYLLLVLKMNLKGLLINYVPSLLPEQFVALHLQCVEPKASLYLSGIVHKIITNANGLQGTIIRFANLSQDHIKQLQHLLSESTQSKHDEISTPTPTIPSREKTIIVQKNTLSHLLLQSPDRDVNQIQSTFDEEAIHQRSQALAGSTMIAYADDFRPIKAKRKWKRKLFLVVIAFIIMWWLLPNSFKHTLQQWIPQKIQPTTLDNNQEPEPSDQ